MFFLCCIHYQILLFSQATNPADGLQILDGTNTFTEPE